MFDLIEVAEYPTLEELQKAIASIPDTVDKATPLKISANLEHLTIKNIDGVVIVIQERIVQSHREG